MDSPLVRAYRDGGCSPILRMCAGGPSSKGDTMYKQLVWPPILRRGRRVRAVSLSGMSGERNRVHSQHASRDSNKPDPAKARQDDGFRI